MANSCSRRHRCLIEPAILLRERANASDKKGISSSYLDSGLRIISYGIEVKETFVSLENWLRGVGVKLD